MGQCHVDEMLTGMDWGLRYPEEPTTRVDNDFGIHNINLRP